ncbi:MAG: ATP-dependent endonuclease [Candidatus Gastranaerophilales bacterium]|nr:ATP-dependent endonuclease [Candidatus Gastranaerophilales bacterium]
MKYKSLTKSQIVISIDRLTRFKPTEEKYVRVFRDIIMSNLLEPKLKKSEIERLDYAELKNIAEKIFNSSFKENSETTDLRINTLLKEYENKVFHNDENVQKLLDNRLNLADAIKFIDKDNSALNLEWLKYLSTEEDFRHLREELSLLYPLEKIVIAEGITEEILLPAFAAICGYNFNRYGVKVIAAGGKNQVVKLYYKLRNELKLPIFILLDRDAESNEESINTKLRDCDKVHLLDSGEFEDLLPKNLIVKTVNSEFKNFVSISEDELEQDLPMVKILEEFFKEKGLHEFKKAEFANRIKQQISSDGDISDEVRKIIEEIKFLN